MSTTCARSGLRTSRRLSSPTARATGCSRGTYAERAREAYAQLADRVHVGELTNNLGGLNFLLGKTDEAMELLKEAFAIALETGRDADAGRAVSSLAQVHLRTGDLEQAEEQARHALELLDGRVDYVDEVGNAQLVLGRSLLEQGRLDEAEAAFLDAEASFAELGSGSHRAAAWVARGDLAARRGDHERRRSSIGRPPRRYRTSGSREMKEVTTMTKLRIIYLLLIASLFAYILAARCHRSGMSDGGGF